MRLLRPRRALLVLCWLGACAGRAGAADLVQTIAAIKPAIVGVGSYQAMRSPAVSFVGTGFVVGDGLTVVTNAHVVAAASGDERKDSKEGLRVLVARGANVEAREAALLVMDKLHDLALLRMSGAPEPALRVGDSDSAREGQMLAFTGFPLTAILGFHPVTHRAMISAITVVATPAPNARSLDAKAIVQLQRSAYPVFQLDGTAYPGFSGSPLYDPESGVVLGVINKVLNATKESAISAPSGITYAIPAKFVQQLMTGR